MLEIIEAIVFASGSPIAKKEIVEKIPALTTRELNGIIEKLKAKYSGDSGILFLTFNDKLQFSSNPSYSDTMEQVLTPIREKELSQKLLEVLAVIAYKQPITRPEIEELKGNASEYQISMLEKAQLIEVIGRKAALGRPLLYGTTDNFLKKFQLESLTDLPSYETVLQQLAEINGNVDNGASLFSDRSLSDSPEEIIVEPIKIPEVLLKPNTNVIAKDDDDIGEDADEAAADDLDDDIFGDDDDDDLFGDGEEFETYE